MNYSEIYTHFHPDERIFVDRAMDWIVKADQYHEVKLTDFLDPRQQFIMQSLVNRNLSTKLLMSGGYPEAERKRAMIAQDYRVLDEDELAIKVLAISSEDVKIIDLDHGDYLGAILGLGIKRDKVGDIHVHDDGCHCLAASEIIEFLYLQLQQVHKVYVSTEILPLDQLRCSNTILEELSLSVASLRLDGIVSDVVRMSRAKILAPIKAGKCRLNWKTELDPSKLLKVEDMVSFKGFGRFKILEIEGMTKKGRVRVKIGKFM